MGVLLLILLPAALFVGAVVLVLHLRDRAGASGGTAPASPWWGRQATWVGLGLVFLLLGAVFAPRLLGFTFLFLPFLWVRGVGRRRRRDGR